MTVEEKVAQLTCLWPSDRKQHRRLTSTDRGDLAPKAKEVMKYGIGQSPARRTQGPRAGALFANALQKWLIENTRLGIPAIFHDEILHGHMACSTSFPSQRQASSWDPEFLSKVFTVAALETRARGSHQVLGPNLDIAREPRWGRTEETYGEDPYLTSRIAVSIVKAIQGPGPTIDNEHVIATAKHFAAHGQPEAGTNVGPANFSENAARGLFAQLRSSSERGWDHECDAVVQRDRRRAFINKQVVVTGCAARGVGLQGLRDVRLLRGAATSGTATCRG
jgi:beta-glucosidase